LRPNHFDADDKANDEGGDEDDCADDGEYDFFTRPLARVLPDLRVELAEGSVGGSSPRDPRLARSHRVWEGARD
jgi:hypothetical protein